MGAVIGMGVWGLDPVSKPAIGGTVVGQLALIKTNGLSLNHNPLFNMEPAGGIEPPTY